MKRIFLFIFFTLFLSSLVFALEECKGVMNQDELPCNNLLQVDTTVTPCNTLTVSFFNNQSTLYHVQTMSQYNPDFCNGTFNPGDNFSNVLGTYTFVYSTGDTGSIIVEEGFMNFFNLLVYLVFMTIGFVFLFCTYQFRNAASTAIAFGWMSAAMFAIVGATIVATDFTVVTGVKLFFDADVYLGIISFALSFFVAYISVNIRKASRPHETHVW